MFSRAGARYILSRLRAEGGVHRTIMALLWLLLSAAAWADNKDDFLAARDALAKGDLPAVAARAEALSGDPLGIYPRYWLLSRQLELLKPEQILPFLDYYKGSWLAEKLRGEWLASLGRRGDWARFREQFVLLQGDASTDLYCYSVQARLADADKDRARDILGAARSRLWFTAQDLPAACTPVVEQLLSSGVVGDDDLWARLRLAFENASQGLARDLASRLGQELSPKVLDLALNNPQAWLKKPGASGRLRQELAVLAIARLARSDVDAAYAQLQAWKPRLDSGTELYAWRRLATVAAFRHDPRAEEWFRASSKLPWTDYALEWRVRLALRQQDWETVRDAIRLMSDANQKDRAWQYWLARALEATHANTEASRILASLSLNDDYYGLLARDRLGPMVGPGKAVYKLGDDDQRRVAANQGLQRALLLNDMGLRTEATREWNWALRGADDRLLLAAAEAARDAGWYDRAIYAAERTQNLHNYELRYLAPYRDIVRDYAEQVGLDEAWVFGLMRQESRFVNVARSGVGAGGLMQLMPATARWVARKIGLRYEPAMVNDAGTNVRLGTYYLKHVLDELSGQPVLATAGYNAGPRRAREWQPAGQPMEAALYIESIPFGETRDYVKKVMTNAVHYAMAFGQSQPSLSARIGMIPPLAAAGGEQAIDGP